MKTHFCLLSTLGVCFAASAQTAPVAPPAAVIVAQAAISAPAPSSWLAGRGVLSVDELGALTGARFSPAERARLERAVAARNTALLALNAQLAVELSQILQQGDAQIGVRIETKAAQDQENERMERMKRLQPTRYREMMHRKRAKEKAAEKGK